MPRLGRRPTFSSDAAIREPDACPGRFLTVAISVRHSGQATYPAQLYDAQAAVRWLRANPMGLPVDPDRIGIWGHSAGGHLAAMVGLAGTTPVDQVRATAEHGSRVEAVVTISAPSDFLHPGGAMLIDCPSPITALVGGDVATHREQLRLASPLAHVAAGSPPFLIIHGTLDETVPYNQAERLHHALRAQRVDTQLLPIPGGHHNLRTDLQAPYEGQIWYDVARAAARFFHRHLPRSID